MHWAWAVEPSRDGLQALIQGTAAALDLFDLNFEEARTIAQKLPPIEIVRGTEFRGELADQVHVSGLNGLLFAPRLRSALAEACIDNIQYWPVSLLDPADGSSIQHYHLANILGRVACLDREASVIESSDDDPARIDFIEVLAIDEQRARGFDLFRLHEYPYFILASDHVKKACERHGVTGVGFYKPTEYPY